MLFPFAPARAAVFHMGAVQFPIDLVFADAAGRVGRIVHNAQPGARTRWAHPVCSAVVELQGGACAAHAVEVGHQMRIAVSRHQAQTYNLLRTLVEADGYYSKEPLLPGGVSTPHTRPIETRFEDRKLPDEAFPDAMDQPQDGWVQQIGYQPTDELADQGVGPNVRMTAQIQDPGELVATMIEAMARQQMTGRAPIHWAPDLLNDGTTESAVVTPHDVMGWLQQLGLGAQGKMDVARVVTPPSGMLLLGDGLVLAGLADQSQVRGDKLVLFRGRR